MPDGETEFAVPDGINERVTATVGETDQHRHHSRATLHFFSGADFHEQQNTKW